MWYLTHFQRSHILLVKPCINSFNMLLISTVIAIETYWQMKVTEGIPRINIVFILDILWALLLCHPQVIVNIAHKASHNVISWAHSSSQVDEASSDTHFLISLFSRSLCGSHSLVPDWLAVIISVNSSFRNIDFSIQCFELCFFSVSKNVLMFIEQLFKDDFNRFDFVSLADGQPLSNSRDQ